MKAEETGTQNIPRGTTLIWYSTILTQIFFFFSWKTMNRLWAKVIEQALKMYAGHRQQHGLAADSENVFSNHI